MIDLTRPAVRRYLVAYALTVGGMHAIDGPWKRWTKGGAVDMWTLTHVLWSVIGQRMGLTLQEVMTLATANEALEWGVRSTRPDMLWGTPESITNAMMDLTANWAGYRLAEVASR